MIFRKGDRVERINFGHHSEIIIGKLYTCESDQDGDVVLVTNERGGVRRYMAKNFKLAKNTTVKEILNDL